MSLKTAERMANSVDPNRTPYSEASDLDLHCFLRPVFIINIRTS